MFHKLTRENIKAIAGKMLEVLAKRLEDNGIAVEFTDAAIEKIAENGFDAVSYTHLTYGAKGLIDSPSDVGGYPELTGTKAKDSDNDGIPNEWEDANGLDKFDPADSTTIAPGGYLYVCLLYTSRCV